MSLDRLNTNTLDNRFSSSDSSSSRASNTETFLIFFGIIILLLVLGLTIYLFMRIRKNKKYLEISQPTTSSNFSKLNSDRQEEELKKQTSTSSLQTPYIRN